MCLVDVDRVFDQNDDAVASAALLRFLYRSPFSLPSVVVDGISIMTINAVCSLFMSITPAVSESLQHLQKVLVMNT